MGNILKDMYILSQKELLAFELDLFAVPKTSRLRLQSFHLVSQADAKENCEIKIALLSPRTYYAKGGLLVVLKNINFTLRFNFICTNK